MFEFLLALFGVPYYATRYAYERDLKKSKDKEIEDNLNTLQERKEAWVSLVCDNDLEKEMANIAKYEWKNADYFYEFANAIEEINSVNHSFELLNNVCHKIGDWYQQYGKIQSNFLYHQAVYLRTLVFLVNRGKLPRWEAEHGFMITQPKGYDICVGVPQDGKLYRYDLMMWVIRKLAKVGIQTKPYVLYHSPSYECEPLTKNNGWYTGEYIWEALVPPWLMSKQS